MPARGRFLDRALCPGKDIIVITQNDLARLTGTDVTLGTARYMAPERFDGHDDNRVDVYALCCVLHEALTGSPQVDIIGHSMANDSPLFKDLEGWTNDHVDWLKADVRDFRKRVVAEIRKSR